MLDMRAIDNLLDMQSGYVLDFNDRTFADFFREHHVEIDAPKYRAEGTSKAKRLRTFLRSAPSPLAGQALAALMEYRLAVGPEPLRADWDRCAEVARRLGGQPPAMGLQPSVASAAMSEQALLKSVFDPALMGKAIRDANLAAIVTERVHEAERCIQAEANLSAVILAGSVLEALCLDFGARNPERVNRAYIEK